MDKSFDDYSCIIKLLIGKQIFLVLPGLHNLISDVLLHIINVVQIC